MLAMWAALYYVECAFLIWTAPPIANSINGHWAAALFLFGLRRLLRIQ
jgi:hypothetical protein